MDPVKIFNSYQLSKGKDHFKRLNLYSSAKTAAERFAEIDLATNTDITNSITNPSEAEFDGIQGIRIFPDGSEFSTEFTLPGSGDFMLYLKETDLLIRYASWDFEFNHD